jgi:hypothetical protein
LDVVWAFDDDRIVLALHNLLTSTPNLRTLRVSQDGAACLSMVLGKPAPDRLDFDVLCPALTRLSFGMPEQMWWDLPVRWVNPLVVCLSERAACTGSRLNTLEFFGRGRIEKASVEVLAPFVAEIVNSVTAYRLDTSPVGTG